MMVSMSCSLGLNGEPRRRRNEVMLPGVDAKEAGVAAVGVTVVAVVVAVDVAMVMMLIS